MRLNWYMSIWIQICEKHMKLVTHFSMKKMSWIMSFYMQNSSLNFMRTTAYDYAIINSSRTCMYTCIPFNLHMRICCTCWNFRHLLRLHIILLAFDSLGLHCRLIFYHTPASCLCNLMCFLS